MYHRGHVVDPPQSTSVSPEFWTPSKHVVALAGASSNASKTEASATALGSGDTRPTREGMASDHVEVGDRNTHADRPTSTGGLLRLPRYGPSAGSEADTRACQPECAHEVLQSNAAASAEKQHGDPPPQPEHAQELLRPVPTKCVADTVLTVDRIKRTLQPSSWAQPMVHGLLSTPSGRVTPNLSCQPPLLLWLSL